MIDALKLAALDLFLAQPLLALAKAPDPEGCEGAGAREDPTGEVDLPGQAGREGEGAQLQAQALEALEVFETVDGHVKVFVSGSREME